MGYVEKNLVAGEEVLLRPRYHPVRFAPGAFGVVLGVVIAIAGFFVPEAVISRGILLAVAGGLALVGLVVVGCRALVDSFDEFAVTSARVIKKTGFLTRTVSQISIDKVQDIRLHASLWGRWLSYGDIEVESAGEDGPVVFPRIQDPEKFRNVLFTRQHAALAGASPPPLPSGRSVEDRLKDAERLHKAGALTDEEYKAKREQLIKEL